MDRSVAEQARDRMLLGFHDIRIGNAPDNRLTKFIGINLPSVLPEARDRFDAFYDLLGAFGNADIGYEEFAARVRRRNAGEDEDADWEEL